MPAFRRETFVFCWKSGGQAVGMLLCEVGCRECDLRRMSSWSEHRFVMVWHHYSCSIRWGSIGKKCGSCARGSSFEVRSGSGLWCFAWVLVLAGVPSVLLSLLLWCCGHGLTFYQSSHHWRGRLASLVGLKRVGKQLGTYCVQ